MINAAHVRALGGAGGAEVTHAADAGLPECSSGGYEVHKDDVLPGVEGGCAGADQLVGKKLS